MHKTQNSYLTYLIAFLLGVCITSIYRLVTQPTSIPNPLTTQNCVTEKKYSVDRIDISGKLIIEEQGHYYLLSLPDMTSVQLPMSILEVSESPNKQIFIAKQWDMIYDQISVFDSNGEILNTFQRGDDWSKEWHLDFSLQWLDEQNFVIGILPAGSKLIINAITRDEQKIIFPDSLELKFEANQSTGFVVFDPKLTQVLYKAVGNIFILKSYDPNTSYTMTVWAKHSRTPMSIPKWSPSGHLVAVAITGENNITDIHTVEYFGSNETQLTNFEKRYNYPIMVRIPSLTWSPDGSRIALNVYVLSSEQQRERDGYNYEDGHLVIVDIMNRKVVDYCQKVKSPVVWSPDGKYVASEGSIIDLANRTSYEVTEGKIYGWLKTP